MSNRQRMSKWTSRPRIPNVFAIIQVTLRLGALGTAIAALTVLCELSVRYGHTKYGIYDDTTAFGCAIATSAIAIVLSLLESIALLDASHKIYRVNAYIIGVGDLAVICVGLSAIVRIDLSTWGFDDAAPDHLQAWRYLANLGGWLTVAIVIEAFLALILNCTDCCLGEVTNDKHSGHASAELTELRSSKQYERRIASQGPPNQGRAF